MSSPFTNCKVVGSGIDPEAYHRTSEKRGSRDFPVSKSMLSEFTSCPARWIRGFVRPESKALTNGSLVDCLLLTPERFYQKYIECPAEYPAAKTGELKPWSWAANYCKDWRETNKDREPIKSKPLEEARAAVSTVIADSDLSEMLHLAQKQIMVVGEYHNRSTGLTVPVKALLDIVPAKDGRWGKYLWDFKTCRSANMRKWQRDCFDFGYAIQAAFHSDLYCAATGEDRPTFAHIVQESVAPFHVEKRMMSLEFVELGRGQYLSALSLYCRCLATGVWPGYHADTIIDGCQLVQPEAWMIVSSDNRPFEITEEESLKPDDNATDLIP